MHNGQCVPPTIPRVDIIPGCLRNQVRLANGRCGHPPTIVRIPGRLHVDVPPRHKPQKPPKRERSVAPNWKPQLNTGNVRLNTFHPTHGGGGGGMHRGR